MPLDALRSLPTTDEREPADIFITYLKEVLNVEVQAYQQIKEQWKHMQGIQSMSEKFVDKLPEKSIKYGKWKVLETFKVESVLIENSEDTCNRN